MSGNVFVNGGPVCDDEWDLRDAEVVCRMLFNGPALEATRGSLFGQVTEDFSIARVNCTSEEQDIINCQHNTTIPWWCGSGRAAGVVCRGK